MVNFRSGLIKKFKVLKGVVLDKSVRVLRVKLGVDGSEVLVHAPDRVGGLLKEGTQVLVQPFTENSKTRRWCTHRVIAVKSEFEFWIGANPVLVNELIQAIWAKGLLYPDLELEREITIGDSRLDFLFSDKDCKIYAEAKACSCIFPESIFPQKTTDHLRILFPCKSLLEDAERIKQNKKAYSKPISPRSLKHLSLIKSLNGVMIFATQAPVKNVSLNVLDPLIDLDCKELKKLVLVFSWEESGNVYFKGFGRFIPMVN